MVTKPEDWGTWRGVWARSRLGPPWPWRAGQGQPGLFLPLGVSPEVLRLPHHSLERLPFLPAGVTLGRGLCCTSTFGAHGEVGCPGGSSGKEPTCHCRRPKNLGLSPWVGKIPRRRAWQPSPVFLPGGSQGQRSLEGYSPRGRKESDTTEATQRARGRVDRWMDGRSGGGKLRPQRCQLVWRLPRPRCDRRGQGVGQLGE